MLVSKILSDVRPAHGGTWDAVIENLMSDPHERRRIDVLKAEIQERGQIEPGIVLMYELDEDDPEGMEPYLFLADGTHRFVATVALGLEDYPVIEGYPKSDDSQPYYLSTEVIFWIDKGYDADKIMDCLMSSLSFRLDDDYWVTCEGLDARTSKNYDEHTVYFTHIPDNKLDAFVAKFFEHTACCLPREAIQDFKVSQARNYENIAKEIPHTDATD